MIDLGNGHVMAVQSESDPSRLHLVAWLYDQKKWACSCPAGAYGNCCRHIAIAIAMEAKRELEGNDHAIR